MTDFESLWKAVEESPPEDPTDLLVCADWAAEQEPKERIHWGDWRGMSCWSDLEYALRWCAARKQRPYKRAELRKPQWGWIPEKPRYGQLTKAVVRARRAAVIPGVVAGLVNGTREWVRWWSSIRAYDALSTGLAVMLSEVRIPDVQLPPPKVAQAPDAAPCPECGVVFSLTKQACPVCNASKKE